MYNERMALLGMSTMGGNLVQNFAEHGYEMWMWNRTPSKTIDVCKSVPRHAPYKKRLHPVTGGLRQLVDKVGRDGIYFVMVKADNPYDRKDRPTNETITKLGKLLKRDAVIGDLANSYWEDTERRAMTFKRKGKHYFGIGVSGGEEGAKKGPAIMPGGTSKEVYDERLKKPLEAIAAKAPLDKLPCVTWIGFGGAGHYVKMVHNGIEYADMQYIAETYDLMRACGMKAPEISEVFSKWNEGRLQSYLIEITAEILRHEDPWHKGEMLVDYIKDEAQMKGTGTWTVMSSLKLKEGVEPIPGIYSAVESRSMSAKGTQRPGALTLKPRRGIITPKEVTDLENALYVSKIASYAQGISLMQAAAEEYNFGGLNIGEIARIWRAGCIIRAKFLDEITHAYRMNPDLENLMLAPAFREAINESMGSLKRVSRTATTLEVPIMAIDSAKNFILQASRRKLPANLTQAQRDYFGAHTYRRIDREGSFHTDWTGNGEGKKIG